MTSDMESEVVLFTDLIPQPRIEHCSSGRQSPSASRRKRLREEAYAPMPQSCSGAELRQELTSSTAGLSQTHTQLRWRKARGSVCGSTTST